VLLTPALPSKPTPNARPIYGWCDWCDEEWEAIGARLARNIEGVWETTDHNYRCQEGGRYVGYAWTVRERARRRGELFPGDG
jgi:hypothetical protein